LKKPWTKRANAEVSRSRFFGKVIASVSDNLTLLSLSLQKERDVCISRQGEVSNIRPKVSWFEKALDEAR
jgi:hypothetical protein